MIWAGENVRAKSVPRRSLLIENLVVLEVDGVVIVIETSILHGTATLSETLVDSLAVVAGDAMIEMHLPRVQVDPA